MRSRELQLMHRSARAAAVRTVMVYLVIVIGWSLLAEGLVQAFGNAVPQLKWLEIYKAEALIALSAFAVYLVARRVMNRATLVEFDNVAAESGLALLHANLPGIAFRYAQDFTRRMLSVGGDCAELTGYSANELQSNLVAWQDLMHADDRKQVDENITDALKRHQRYRVTYRIRTRDGEERWVMEQGCGVDEIDGSYQAVEGLMVDVTRQQLYERQLEEQREHLEEIVAARTSELVTEIEQRRELEIQLREMSVRDALTGLGNRRVMDTFITTELSRAERYDHPFAVIMMDLDHFKILNDTYGHQGGDEVLRWVAGIIKASVRSCDRAVRYGGEEMAILLPESDIDGAFLVAERVRQRLDRERIDLALESGEVVPVHVTMSIGVAAFPAHASDADLLISAADQALYRAKRSGRNRVCRAGTELLAMPSAPSPKATQKTATTGPPRPAPLDPLAPLDFGGRKR